MKSINSLPKGSALILRDLRDNLVWLFLVSLLTLLIEPFALYLTGICEPDLSKNTFWQADFRYTFLMLNRVQTLVLTLLFIVATAFMTFRLLAFLTDKERSYLGFSFPLSRSELFWYKYLAGLLLLMIPLLLDTLIMAWLMHSGPEPLAGLWLPWLQNRKLMALGWLAGYHIALFAMILAGRTSHAFLMALAIQFFLPAIWGLGLLFARDSVPGLLTLDPLAVQLPCFCFPVVLPWFDQAGVTIWLIPLLSAVFFLAVSYVAFCRRPVERAAKPLAELPYSGVFSLLSSLLFGLLGGFFFESLLARENFYIFLAGYFVFSLLAQILYSILAGAKLKHAKTTMSTAVLLSVGLLFLFDCGVENWPVEAAKHWQRPEMESVDLPIEGGPDGFSLEHPCVLRIDQEQTPDLFDMVYQHYQETPVKVVREGIFHTPDQTRAYHRITFRRPDGAVSEVNLSDLPALIERIGESAPYQDLSDCEAERFLKQDRVYLRVSPGFPGGDWLSTDEVVDHPLPEELTSWKEFTRRLATYQAMGDIPDDGIYFRIPQAYEKSLAEAILEQNRYRYRDFPGVTEDKIDEAQLDRLKTQVRKLLGKWLTLDPADYRLDLVYARPIRVPGLLAYSYRSEETQSFPTSTDLFGMRTPQHTLAYRPVDELIYRHRANVYDDALLPRPLETLIAMIEGELYD